MKKDKERELEKLKNELQKNKLPNIKLKKISVFENTLENKFKFSKYCLSRIEEIKRRESDYANIPFVIDFYIDYFFVNTFSIFDILAQIVNLVLSIERNPRKASFCFLTKNETIGSFPKHKLILMKLSKIKTKKWFCELEDFRHCALHNRNIYSEDIIRRRKGGYYLSNASIYEKYLVSDPWSWSPRISKKREVKLYCSRMLNNVQTTLEDSLKFIREKHFKKGGLK